MGAVPAAQRRSESPDEPKMYRAYQLPAVLNLSRAFITRMIATGELPSFTVGAARFVAADDIDAWIERRRNAQQAGA